MIFKEFGNKNNPTIIFIHGGGLSWWSWTAQIEALKGNYHIVAPIIDGYGEDGDNTFISIQNSAEHVINYIKNNCKKGVFAICGLSIGAQIVVEILSRENDIAEKAVIESALVYPMSFSSKLIIPMCSLSYGLIKKRWFAKLQAKQLYVPEELFEKYYEDTLKVSKKSLINTLKSNANYPMPKNLLNTKTKTLILVGEKELSVMKKSAKLLNRTIRSSHLKIIEKCGHGEISLVYPNKYIDLLKHFFSNSIKY